MKSPAAVLGFLSLAVLAGCSSAPATPACVTSFSLQVSAVNADGSAKAAGSADHTQPAPASQQQFTAFSGTTLVSGQCAVAALLAAVHPQWTTSDAIDISISSANDATNGLATCLGTTLAPATITATLTSGGVTKTSTSSLTCY